MKYAPHTHTNDNEDTWQPLSAATERVLKPEEDQNKEGGEDRSRADKSEQDSEQHKAYVERRLRDLRAFEALYRDAMKRR